jgi:osmoprotectant transport system permease protein
MNIVSSTVAWLTDPVNWSGASGIPTRLLEHVEISAVTLAIALLIALPLGLWIGHTDRGARLAVAAANFGRAVPTLAVMGIVAPFTTLIDPGLGFVVYPTVVAMVLLAVPPIMVNAYAGIHDVDRDLVEAARGIGYRERQILLGVELPISLPVVSGGIRSASVQVIATATLGALFGFGGLGRFLVDGIAQQDTGQTWGGVVLVALLVLTSEGLFALLQRRLISRGLRLQRSGPIPLREPAQFARGGGEGVR